MGQGKVHSSDALHHQCFWPILILLGLFLLTLSIPAYKNPFIRRSRKGGACLPSNA